MSVYCLILAWRCERCQCSGEVTFAPAEASDVVFDRVIEQHSEATHGGCEGHAKIAVHQVE